MGSVEHRVRFLHPVDCEDVADPDDVLFWVKRIETQVQELRNAAEYLHGTRKPTRMTHSRFAGFRMKQRAREWEDRHFIVVVGLGGIGSHLVEALARMDLKRILLVDNGVVKTNDIGSSVYKSQHVGYRKADCMKSLVELLNSNIGVDALYLDIVSDQSTLDKFIRSTGLKPSMIISCLDNLEARIAVCEYCVQTGVPLIDSSTNSTGMQGFIRCYTDTVENEDSLTTCLACDKSAHEQVRQDTEALQMLRQQLEPKPEGTLEESDEVKHGPTEPDTSTNLPTLESLKLNQMEITQPMLNVDENVPNLRPTSIACTNAILAGLLVQRITKYLFYKDPLSSTRYLTSYRADRDLYEVSQPNVHETASSCTCNLVLHAPTTPIDES